MSDISGNESRRQGSKCIGVASDGLMNMNAGIYFVMMDVGIGQGE